MTSSSHASDRAFETIATLLFVVSAAVTIVWSRSMSAMPMMSMPGGWAMTMMWMRMPGETWLRGAASFLGMWSVMTVAMMLPSLVLMLARYRDGLRAAGEMSLGLLTAVAGAGYLAVWTAVGLAIYPAGMVLADIAMREPALSRAVPIVTAVIVVIATALQFTGWKAQQVACCREASARVRILPTRAGTAWRHGVRLGVQCLRCCANLMAILLVLGVMDLRVMAVVTAAITLERHVVFRRHAPAGRHAACRRRPLPGK